MSEKLRTAWRALSSPFVNEELYRRSLGGGHAEMATVARYLRIPVADRPLLSFYFDPYFYISENPEAGGDGEDPLVHFLDRGFASLRSPHPLIDLTFITSQDAHALGAPPRMDLLLDLLDYDLAAPSPYLDREFYRAQLGASAPEQGLLNHFITKGVWAQRLPSSWLDPVWYADRNPDSPQDPYGALRHFVMVGDREARPAGPKFDGKLYWQRYPDVAEAGVAPLRHFVTQGHREGRQAAMETAAPLPQATARQAPVPLARPVDAQSLAADHASMQVHFGRAGNAGAFLGAGWAEAEDGFIWAIGDQSDLTIRAFHPGMDITLELDLWPHVNPVTLPQQRLSVTANGIEIGSIAVTQEGRIAFPIPARIWPRHQPLVLTLHHPDSARPSDLGDSIDTRLLAVAVRSLRLSGNHAAGASQTRLSRPGRRPIDLIFLEDAHVAEGVPANFKSAANYIQVSPLVKHAVFSSIRGLFRHRRPADLGDHPGYLVLGLFGGPDAWNGKAGEPALQHVVPGLRDLLRQHTRLDLLLDYSWEGGTSASVLDGFDETVRNLDIDPARITFLVSNAGLVSRHAIHLASRPAAPPYRIIGLDFVLAFSGAEAAHRHVLDTANALPTMASLEARRGVPRSFKLLSLNRRPRWHRFMLAMMLRDLGLQNQAAVSMPSQAYQGDWVSEAHLIDSYGSQMTPALWQSLSRQRDATLESLPWILDKNMDRTGHTSQYAYDRQAGIPYEDSYLNVVTESYFEGHPLDVFITEKTCKAMLGLQPFVMFGHRGTLARLAHLGFAPCFGGMLDGHDLLDDGPRLDALYQTLAQIAGWSMQDIHALYHDEVPTLAHNRQHLLEMPGRIGRALYDALDR